jgi:hypothetical protein
MVNCDTFKIRKVLRDVVFLVLEHVLCDVEIVLFASVKHFVSDVLSNCFITLQAHIVQDPPTTCTRASWVHASGASPEHLYLGYRLSLITPSCKACLPIS